MFFSTIDLCLDGNRHSCEKNWTHISGASGSYGSGRLVGRRNMGGI